MRTRSANRFSTTIWPGFVDVMSALLMVLLFVLSVFVAVQALMRDRITAQDDQLGSLSAQIAGLAQALTASETQARALSEDLEASRSEAEARAARIAALSADLAARDTDLQGARGRISDFEAEVAALLAARAQSQAEIKDLTTAREAEAERASVAELAVASARAEIDAQAEAARLAAARREALEALIADLRRREGEALTRAETGEKALSDAHSEAEAMRLADAAAAQALRDRLTQSGAELSAMTLALEAERKRAEETLTLLAAAEAAKSQLTQTQASEAEKQAALLALAQEKLAQSETLSDQSQREVALLNEQVTRLTQQLAALQTVLDATGAEKADAEVRLSELGGQLNAALLRAAEAEKARAAVEAEARAKAEAEAADLARYRSEFFGRLSQILAGREGVQVVGDRFVFSSEVLFAPGEAVLSPEGRTQIASVAGLLQEVAAEIPPEIDWMIRVDGHTDDVPLSGTGRFRDNWELSQARALAVVRDLVALGFPPDRLAATGFADNRPAVPLRTPEARAANRRIELKLTEQ